MREKIVAGNWKMNLDLNEGKELIIDIVDRGVNENVTSIISPPFTHLQTFKTMLSHTNIALAAQNCHQQDEGAFTGEVSVKMLKSVGVQYIILGHSERREYFQEDSLSISFKVNNVLKHGLKPIYCCGETLAQRQDGEHFETIRLQIEQGLFQLNELELFNCIIAYEPVWAIGTGETASPEQAQEMHAFIRNTIASRYSEITANSISILYGGSVKPSNANELFSCSDIDGGLIGGASLDADSFIALTNSF
ncbi:MAG TPA: triose-phosphate isomerase [Bacteroidetes bacterium]|jgi:triosephosphate isomerase (TIM)|nr:triose-phosphate isomerase [Bacteroidota bacterium]